MEFTSNYNERADEIVALFASTFTASEGAEEGELIAKLAGELLSTTPGDDMAVFSALENGVAIGSIIFTRLKYPDDERQAFLLSPVAVATTHQGRGVGQKLIKHGLEALKAMNIDAVFTYGDINFYAKVGFAQINEETARAPLHLQYPEGWLGQALSEPVLRPFTGRSCCVDALNDQSYW